MLANPITAANDIRVAAQPVIEAHNLTVAYGETKALHHVSFCVAQGEKVAIIGPNGAGKSTLVKAILGMVTPNEGEIVVHGRGKLPLSYVPQHEAVNLDFPVTVGDVVMMGRLRQIGWLKLPRKRDWDAVGEALERVGLSALAKQQIGELSGGQRRRAFIARALAQQADILILDEPMSGVDVNGQADIMTVLDDLNVQGLTILMTTHDLDLAFHRFPKVMALKGRIVAFGTPAEVNRPQVLAQVYERALTTWAEGAPLTMLIDEHGCPDCE
jgi:ABC-type Mn2+/Zn2+ transport system ATPase subunit